MAKLLELYFNAEYGPEKIVVREPDESLDPATIKAAMEQIIAANVFAKRNGLLVSPKSARYVDRSVQDIEF
ncbi:DUF2922 domain-containing protein [Bacillus sp. B190/17]|uniref:DUF2922 domain-containing protein n=1 Tax=Bacillus lumedeiriae TaxID=3058829 RepID=A0ABW8IC80_9BACI